MRKRIVYFAVPKYELPSWGVGMIYNLAFMSRSLGLEAFILQLVEDYRVPPWLEIKVDQVYLGDVAASMKESDCIIIPEVMASLAELSNLKAEKIVFVQGGFLITRGLNGAENFSTLGFTKAITVMPHINQILNDFWPIDTTVITPFVENNFFSTAEERIVTRRKRQILLFPKPGYQMAGYFDYEIVIEILHNRIAKINQGITDEHLQWKVIELKGYSHNEVAVLMKESTFFINTNCFESLNATVAEAMAAGCITFCYEAYGGQDYLQKGKNAFVFQNNYVYPLLKELLSLIENIESKMLLLSQIRQNARRTAGNFNRERTVNDLKSFYEKYQII